MPAKKFPIVVTGASRGIGAALAKILMERGESVIGTARNAAADSTGLRILPLDLSDDESVQSFAAQVAEPFDILINNAGTATTDPRSGRAEADWDRLTRAEFMQILTTNVVGTFFLTRALLPRLRQGQRKIIVNVSSNLGSISRNTTGGRYAYRSSKAALNMVTKTLAADLHAEGFTCIAWNPGWVKTEMGGEEADLTPEQSAADLADFLPQITSAHNGQFLDHRGGQIEW